MKYSYPTKLQFQRGLSLVEILVAITVSMILLGGVLQIYVNSKQTYRVEENLSRLQENGRFIMDTMSRDLRMAGYSGCSTFGPVTNTLKNQANLLYNFGVGVEGYNNIGGAIPVYLSNVGITPKAGTDVIVLRRNSDNPVRIVDNNNGAQVFVEHVNKVPGGCPDGSDKISDICAGDILMVTDCEKARVFQTANTQSAAGETILNLTHPNAGDPGNDPSSWGGSSAPDEERFGPGAELVKISAYAYYIETVNGVDTLFRFQDGVENELAEYIEDLQVMYGVDTNGDRNADVYQDADAVVDWEEVITARIHILISTPDDSLTTSAQGYNYFGNDVAPADVPDRRIRQEFTSTVTLRNRAS